MTICPSCGAKNVGPQTHCLVCRSPLSEDVAVSPQRSMPAVSAAESQGPAGTQGRVATMAQQERVQSLQPTMPQQVQTMPAGLHQIPVTFPDVGSILANEKGERVPADTTQVMASLLTPGVTLIDPRLGGFVAADGSILNWPVGTLQGVGGRLDTSEGKIRLTLSAPGRPDAGEIAGKDTSTNVGGEAGAKRSAIVFRAAGGKIAAVAEGEDAGSQILAVVANNFLNGDGAVNQQLASKGLTLVSVSADPNGLIKVVTARGRAQALQRAQRLGMPTAQQPPAPFPPQPVVPVVPVHPQTSQPAPTQTPPPPQAGPRFCPNCGRPRKPGTRFCTSCGHPLAG